MSEHGKTLEEWLVMQFLRAGIHLMALGSKKLDAFPHYTAQIFD